MTINNAGIIKDVEQFIYRLEAQTGHVSTLIMSVGTAVELGFDCERLAAAGHDSVAMNELIQFNADKTWELLGEEEEQ